MKSRSSAMPDMDRSFHSRDSDLRSYTLLNCFWARLLSAGSDKDAEMTEVRRMGHSAIPITSGVSISFGDLFEIKIREIHVPVCHDVHGENILSFAEAKLEKLRCKIPVVPLTPGHGVRGVVCC